MRITTDATTSTTASTTTTNEILKCIPKSIVAHQTTNPIRNITDSMKTAPNPSKPIINLGLGDPTIYGNLNPAPQVIEAMTASVSSLSHNGYPPAFGTEDARRSIADRYNRLNIEPLISNTTTATNLKPIKPEDVTITSGCSGALEMCFNLLASQGERILLPKPGFSFYQTACDSRSIKTESYNLLPDSDWEIDLADVERILSSSDSSTPCRAWLINNPSNPCGSVYSKKHLQDCKNLAKRYGITIISDEIYEDLTFEPNHFYPLGTLEPVDLPMLTVGGLAKRFLVPGWRCGWIILHHDSSPAKERTSELRRGLVDLAGVLLGCCSLVQGAMPAILADNPKITEHCKSINESLKENAMICYSCLQGIPKLSVVRPQGAMYMMIGLAEGGFDFVSDVECCKLLMQEESVACLPGCIFGMEGCYLRLVFCAPPPMLKEAGSRMKAFFERHLL